MVKLGGEWAFYWDRHLSFEQFQRDADLQPDLFAAVQDKWNGYRVNGARLSGSGYGNYKLTVKVNETNRELALKVLTLAAAYRIYIYDQWLGSAGYAAHDAANFEA